MKNGAETTLSAGFKAGRELWSQLWSQLGSRIAALSSRGSKPALSDLDALLQSLQPKRVSVLDRWFPPRHTNGPKH